MRKIIYAKKRGYHYYHEKLNIERTNYFKTSTIYYSMYFFVDLTKKNEMKNNQNVSVLRVYFLSFFTSPLKLCDRVLESKHYVIF